MPPIIRQDLIRRLVGAQVPRLWCPPVTHYTDTGAIDTARMAAHWRTLQPHVGGLLVPGSTGDGWEMAPEEVETLLAAALDLCAGTEMRLLIGVLRTEAGAMVTAISDIVDMLKARTGEQDMLAALVQARVCGFAVCPPRGAELAQEQIQAGLEAVLDLGVPVALYQLPQITQNEMSPELVAGLAARYENLIMFKDTSGADRVPLSDRGQSGVILVRGAEGEYVQWLRESGKPYHGWLLSTANSFPAELNSVATLLEIAHDRERMRKLLEIPEGEHPPAFYLDAAQQKSEKLSGVFYAMAKLVSALPHGNLYANANKAMDHWMAYGLAAPGMPAPMLHAGVRLPADIIAKTGKILTEAGLMPRTGYLSESTNS
ncbi:MAG: dihydrodipicolinate synthase family protein [Anaerolineae bacterium]|nr:dihydrodipicolinate synthase family protein [Anaerolineae bacterium]